MTLGPLKERTSIFREWWRRPPTRTDRILGAVIGGLGSFWIGLFGRITIGPSPISISALCVWALISALTGIIFGIRFPKVVSIICFPFSMIGIGN
jgi:hypothetical protein